MMPAIPPQYFLLTLFRLLRIPNLLIISLTMYLVRHFIIIPVFVISGHINPSLKLVDLIRLGKFDFFLLVAGALCIAAAGNIINDYFDRGMDAVNKPGKVLVGKIISANLAFKLYLIFNI